ncbi:hypothetical protein [Stenotrophomonas sp. NLF4-10]|uniref:hypothetical protein n=1 Tax=Stenotrophomonas sp. NLF4-10 TaxID=2918754 RepID=UPI001EFBF06D|nr:hypothetical protein [Stenotrophomonas sp. NLF4-10]MCG8275978.1 hypothetical protein [Stenotrophomonas sp. NLF4-10]
MRWWTLLLVAAGLAGACNWWSKRAPAADIAVAAEADGFIPVEMPSGIPRNMVLVLAPPNCPSEQAQRAEALIRELTDIGIPVKRGSSFSFDLENPSREQRAAVDRTVAVFKQGAPAVFINGMGMSNPSTSQVVAVYRSTRRG